MFGGAVAEESGCEDRVDVLNGFEHAFSAVAGLVAVAEFDSFVFAGGGTGRNGGAADGATFEVDVNFDGRIAAGIDHFAATDFNNGGIVHNYAFVLDGVGF